MPMTILSRPVVLVCLILPGASWAQSIPPEKSLEQILEVRRCDPNDLDSVLAATHEASWLMRFLACQMLSYRPGEKSVAALKERLGDSEGEFLIVSAVTGCMERAPATKAIPVLEKLSVSPRAGDLPRKAAQRLLDRKRAEARGEVPVTTRPAEKRPIIINQPAR